MTNKTTFLKRISDAFLPKKVTDILYNTVFFKIGPTDINGWTIIHFINGIIVASIVKDKTLRNAIFLHILWELFQFIAGDNKLDLESLIDISCDTIAFVLGWAIYIKFYEYK